MAKKSKKNFIGNNKDKDEVKKILNRFIHLEQNFRSIGEQFITPKGSILTIVGLYERCKNNKYVVHCSRCSDDIELWGHKTIFATKSDLNGGSCPCGCGKYPKWDEIQYKVLVERRCKELNYTFYGWAEPYKKSTTHLDLYNPKTDNRWYSTPLVDFINPRLKRTDPLEGRERTSLAMTISEEDHIKGFIESEVFLDGTVFEVDKERNTSDLNKTYWKYWCPKCSVDEYVLAGVCDGWFKSSVTGLKEGKCSCRCSKSYRWSNLQREYQVRKMCEEDDLTFLNIILNEDGKAVNLEWICNKGHHCITKIADFLYGNRCITCRDESGNFNGYIPERADEYPDYLYLPKFFFDDIADFVKCGRSFVPEDRFEGLRDDSGADYLENLYLWEGTHKMIYDTEQSIKEILYSEGLNYFESDEEKLFAGSSECYYNTQEVIDKIVKLVEDSPLTLVEDNTK